MTLHSLPFARVEPILFQARCGPPAFLLAYRHVFKVAGSRHVPAPPDPSDGEGALAFEVVEEAGEAPRVAPGPSWFAAPAS